MGIVVLGAVFVDIKGYPSDVYIPGGRNAGRVEQMHGGVSRNIVEDIANVELQPTFIGLVDDTGAGADVVRKLKAHKVNTDLARYLRQRRRRSGGHLQAARPPSDPEHFRGAGRRDHFPRRQHRL